MADMCECHDCGYAWMRGRDGTHSCVRSLRTRLDERDAEIKRLEKLVYVPGVLACAKCEFQQVSIYLHVNTGQRSANNSPQQCPNGCGPLWRVTERDAGNEMVDRCEALQAQLDAKTAQCKRLQEHANRLSFNLVHDDIELPLASSGSFSALQDVMAELEASRAQCGGVGQLPLQPIIDSRFRANSVVQFLLDNGPHDMNTLACEEFDDADREQFAQLIGYSVGGFSELSYVSDETYARADLIDTRLRQQAKEIDK